MFLLMGAHLVWLAALLGLGSLPVARRCLLGREEEGREADDDLLLRGVLGFILLSAAGNVLAFFLPLSKALAAAVAFAGCALFYRYRPVDLGRLTRLELLMAAFLLELASALAARWVLLYDTGLYHLQAIAWLRHGPAPLGLANLDERLGFGSSWFTAAAFFGFPGVQGGSPQLASSLLVLLFALDALRAAGRIVRDGATLSRLLRASYLIPCGFAAMDGSIPSTSTDLPVTLLSLLVLTRLARRQEDGRAESPLLLTISLYAVTVKPSAIPLVLAGVSGLLQAGMRADRGALVRALRLAVAPTLLVPVPWMARGVALSGYPLYPAPFPALVPWAVPADVVRGLRQLIVSWARLERGEAAAPHGLAWVAPWFAASLKNPYIWLPLCFAVPGVLLLIVGQGKRPRIGLPLIICSVAVLFWFVAAPDPRLGFGFLFATAALLFATGLMSLSPLSGGRESRRRVIFTAGFLLSVAWVAGMKHWPGGGSSLRRVPPLPGALLEVRHTAQGLAVNVPRGDERCWAAKLPCTPTFRPELIAVITQDGRIRQFRAGPGARLLPVTHGRDSREVGTLSTRTESP